MSLFKYGNQLSEAQRSNPNIDLSGRRLGTTATLNMDASKPKEAPVAVPKKRNPMMPGVLKRELRSKGKQQISNLTGLSRGTIDNVGELLNIAKKQRYDRDMFGGRFSVGRNSQFGDGGYGLTFSKDF